MSSLTYTQSICRAVVAKICLDVGWSSTNISALNVLIDLLVSFIKKLGCKIVEAANHAGRSEPTFEDMALAFKLLDINLDDLKDYISTVEPSPLEFDIPYYPVIRRPNRIFDNCNFEEKRPKYYFNWLPSLKCNANTPAIEPNLEETTTTTTSNNELVENIKENDNDLLKTDNDEGDEEKNKIDENDELDSDDEQKLKFVFKINLEKNTDNNMEEKVEKANNNNSFDFFLNTKSYDVIVNHLMQNKLYSRFTQRGFQDLDDEELRKKLRFPEDEIINENSQTNDLDEDDPDYINIQQDSMKTSPNPENQENENIESPKNVTNVDEVGDNVLNIKVKEAKKKATPQKSSKIDKVSFNIKIPKLITNEDNNENSNLSIVNTTNTTSDENATIKTPAKKRQYKRKDKNAPETRGRKPKKIIYDPPNSTELSNSEQKSELVISDSSNAQVFSPNKSDNSFSANDAAKLLISISNQSRNDLNKLNDDSISNISEGDSLMSQPTDMSLKSSMKKVGRPSMKRSKASAKKVAISAEVVESSGDTSGDDVNIDKNPVSLLVNPEFSNDGFPIEDISVNRKRKHSNSSFSSLSSICTLNSPKQTHTFAINDADANSHNNFYKDHEMISNVPDESINSNTSEKISKHKKSKKHSKSKHRHKDKDDKSHKKHKKSKDKDKHKHKHKHGDSKDRKKDIEKEKIGIPKINIKLEPGATSAASTCSSLKTANQAENLNPIKPTFIKMDSNNFTETKPTVSPSSSLNESKKEVMKTEEIVKKKKNINNNDKNKILPENPLVFIKDSSKKHKEMKSKKNPIINVNTSLFADTPATSSSTSTNNVSAMKYKSKSNKHEKESNKSKLHKHHQYDDDGAAAANAPVTATIVTTPTVSPKTGEIKVKKEKKDKKELNISTSSSNVVATPSTSSSTQKKEGSCIVYSETVKVESSSESWMCPICNDSQIESPMIGCDSCDFWYHFFCVGITVEPDKDEPWYCNGCLSKQKKKLDKYKVKMDKKSKTKYSPNNSQINVPCKAEYDEPSVSIYPISGPSTSSAILSPNYKSTGRPRGRPRKDSGSSSKQPSVTITPIPSTSGMQNKFNYPNEEFSFGYEKPMKIKNTDEKPTSKKDKSICLKCQIETCSDFMIRCDTCYQWYHWHCVGIDTAPSPDSSWHCSGCAKKRTTKRLWTETISDMDSDLDAPDTKNSRLMTSTSQNQSEKNTVCATCKRDNGMDSNWICCDECNDWNHFVCVNIVNEPKPHEPWFCENCIKKQRNIENLIQKHKKKH